MQLDTVTIIQFIHMQSVFKLQNFYSFIVKIRRFMADNVTEIHLFTVQDDDEFGMAA